MQIPAGCKVVHGAYCYVLAQASLRLHGHDDYIVGRHLCGKLAGELSEVLVGPKITDAGREMLWISQPNPGSGDLGFGCAAVEQQHRSTAVFQRLGPDFYSTAAAFGWRVCFFAIRLVSLRCAACPYA